MLSTYRNVGIGRDNTSYCLRADALLRPISFTQLVFTVVVASTGAKTITFTYLNTSITFTTTFSTTGTFRLMIGAIVRSSMGQVNVELLPPTYLSKTAGTIPTNSILKTTRPAITFPRITSRPINWLNTGNIVVGAGLTITPSGLGVQHMTSGRRRVRAGSVPFIFELGE